MMSSTDIPVPNLSVASTIATIATMTLSTPSATPSTLSGVFGDGGINNLGNPSGRRLPACPYCQSASAHPRLGRGEAYACGYKPFRCDVCNYATTTKGNLAIHHQSDKHLNNMREHGNALPALPTSIDQSKAGINSNIYPSLQNTSITSCNSTTKHNSPLTSVSAFLMTQINQQQPNKSMNEVVNSDHQDASSDASVNCNQLTQSSPDLSSTQPLLCQICLSFSTNNPAALIRHAERNLLVDSSSTSTSSTSVLASTGNWLSQLLTCQLFNGVWFCRLCSYRSPLKANFQLHCKTEKHGQRLNYLLHLCEGAMASNNSRLDQKLKLVESLMTSQLNPVSNNAPNAPEVVGTSPSETLMSSLLNFLSSSAQSTSNFHPIQLRCLACNLVTTSVHKFRLHCTSPNHQRAAVLYGRLASLRSSSCHDNVQQGCVKYRCHLTECSDHNQKSCCHQQQNFESFSQEFDSLLDVMDHWRSPSHQQALGRFRTSTSEPNSKSTLSNNIESELGQTCCRIDDEGLSMVSSITSSTITNQVTSNERQSIIFDLDGLNQTEPSFARTIDAKCGERSDPPLLSPSNEEVGRYNNSSDEAIDLRSLPVAFTSAIESAPETGCKELVGREDLTMQDDDRKKLILSPTPESTASEIDSTCQRDEFIVVENDETHISCYSPDKEEPGLRLKITACRQRPLGNSTGHVLTRPMSTSNIYLSPERKVNADSSTTPQSNFNSSPDDQLSDSPSILDDNGKDQRRVLFNNNDIGFEPSKSNICNKCYQRIDGNFFFEHTILHFLPPNKDQFGKALDHFFNSFLILPSSSSGFDQLVTLLDSLMTDTLISHNLFLPTVPRYSQIFLLLCVESLCQDSNRPLHQELFDLVNKYLFKLDRIASCQGLAKSEPIDCSQLCHVCSSTFMLKSSCQLHLALHNLILTPERQPLSLLGKLVNDYMADKSNGNRTNQLLVSVPIDWSTKLNALLSIVLQTNSLPNSSSTPADRFHDQPASSTSIENSAVNGVATASDRKDCLSLPDINGALDQRPRARRARRTRLTCEQLELLRANFNISSLPSDQQLDDICRQAGLTQKVVKHWFRNTLFKERQRNKDSPYNFANPPSTQLNLAEYERSGKIEVAPVNTGESLTPSTDDKMYNASQQSTCCCHQHDDDCSSHQRQRKRPYGEIASDLGARSPDFHVDANQGDHNKRRRTSPTRSSISSSSASSSLPDDSSHCPREEEKHEDHIVSINQPIVSSTTDECFNRSENDVENQWCSNKIDALEQPLDLSLKNRSRQRYSEGMPSSSDPIVLAYDQYFKKKSQYQYFNNEINTSGDSANNTNDMFSFLHKIPSNTSNISHANFPTTVSMQTPLPAIHTSNIQTNRQTFTSLRLPYSRSATTLAFPVKNESQQQSSLSPTPSTSTNTLLNASQIRRNRTSITSVQARCMAEVYRHHKTPSVGECDRLGRLIGLNRRVVQVWFQNQRAKEKKLSRVGAPLTPTVLGQTSTSINTANKNGLTQPPVIEVANDSIGQQTFCQLCQCPIGGGGGGHCLDLKVNGQGGESTSQINFIQSPSTSSPTSLMVEHLFSPRHLANLWKYCSGCTNPTDNGLTTG